VRIELSSVNWLVSERVSESVSQSRVAIAEAGDNLEARGRGMSAIGSFYQKTGENTTG
jgi:hypothetical protein